MHNSVFPFHIRHLFFYYFQPNRRIGQCKSVDCTHAMIDVHILEDGSVTIQETRQFVVLRNILIWILRL